MRTCKVCQQVSAEFVENINGYLEGNSFEIYYCNNCDTSFVNDVNENELELIYNFIYKNGKQVPGYVRYHEYGEQVLKTRSPLNYLAESEDMYWAILDCVRKGLIKKSMKIMEVGCGLGYLTYALSIEGFNIIGIDISSKAIDNAINKYGNFYKCKDVFKMAAETEEKYDVIILTEVIEHVSNPVEFIGALSKLLMPEGRIILTTPNKSAYPNNIYWDSELPPVHLFWFSEKSLNTIGNQLDLKTNFVDFSEYNNNHLDRTKLMPYKRWDRFPILNKNGEIIAIKPNPYKRKLLSIMFKYRVIKFMDSIRMKWFANRKDWQRRQTVCTIYRIDLK